MPYPLNATNQFYCHFSNFRTVASLLIQRDTPYIFPYFNSFRFIHFLFSGKIALLHKFALASSNMLRDHASNSSLWLGASACSGADGMFGHHQWFAFRSFWFFFSFFFFWIFYFICLALAFVRVLRRYNLFMIVSVSSKRASDCLPFFNSIRTDWLAYMCMCVCICLHIRLFVSLGLRLLE